MIKLTVSSLQNGENVVDCIAYMIPGMGREEIAALLEAGKVKIGFRRARPDTLVKKGSTIALHIKKEIDDYLVPPEVVFEDGEFIIFNKPPGLACMSKTWDGAPTLYTFSVEHMKGKDEYDVDTLRVPYVCYRLPKNMGGLVIVAKSQAAFENTLYALKERRIKRFYKTIVSGEVKENGLLNQFILRNGDGEVKVFGTYAKGARPSALKYGCMDKAGDLSVLQIELVTNEANHILAQLAAAEMPVLGDVRYGSKKINKKYAVYRPAIWAHKIVFETGRRNSLDYLNGTVIETDNARLPDLTHME